MTSSLKQLSSVMTELAVSIPKEDIAEALNQAYSKLGRTAKISGFRKGKVPRAVLRRMFGDAVGSEIRGDLVSTHLQEALKEHDLLPLSEPEIEAGDLNEKEDYQFTIKFENRHKVEEIDYTGIELERHNVVIKPEDVDKEIEKIRSSMAEVIDLEKPRPAAQGDLAKIKLKNWVDGEWKDTPWPEQQVVIGENTIDKKIDDVLIGMNANDEEVADLGSDKDLDEKRTRYLVCLISIQERKLPELDDEFAKDVGDYDTLDALKKGVEEKLNKEGELAEDARVQNLFFDALREKNSMELPPTLLARQEMMFKMQVQSSLSMLGEEGPGEEEEKKMEEKAKSAAEDMVQQHLLVLECSRLENIEVTDQDVDAEIEDFAQSRGLPMPMVKAEYAKEGRREELAHKLLEKKIFDFALPKVTINKIDPPAEPNDGKGQ
ncbi:MAG: trigger factor [Proteobacteria bacterium]|nr:trigger factor [Pseudomonadota bacterium]